MTESQFVLVSLLKKSLFGCSFKLPKRIDWHEVFNEAVKQSVVPIAFDGTKGFDIPTNIFSLFKNYTVSVMLKNIAVTEGQDRLVRFLNDKKIEYAVLKGLSVTEYYPNQELRTLGDVDFLVRKSKFQKTKKLLAENGYELVEDELNHFHCTYAKDGVIFELHFELSEFPNDEIGRKLRIKMDGAMNHVIDNGRFKSLNVLYQGISLLLHTERHLSKDGIGIRQLLDFGFFLKKNCTFLIENRDLLIKFGLYKLAQVLDNLFRIYFLDEKATDTSAELLMEMALKKGNFGIKADEDEVAGNRVLASREGLNRIVFVRWFRYFRFRSSITWMLAKKHPWLSNFGFVYIPFRYLFRRVFSQKKAINISTVINSSQESNELFEKLAVFKN